ncbi:chemotaxis protein CheX [Paenibacillus flagellatus]|uniref:Chemotaxis phosphatase CheX-like domain-containing protein n=1 Tax=Paenibacillus flagellatus TaxID=2211139 RepID=A0A2V5KK15_9BACL|nr:chemotaxis protein CheX [Paenibacillus flagellatus]PYI50847.1 hypothetical protein DLM86_27655 [Paenibacillus flagellatus]
MEQEEELRQLIGTVGANVMTGYLGIPVNVSERVETMRTAPSKDVSVHIELLGSYGGKLVFSMEEPTAKRIVGTMMGGVAVEELDELGWSAIREFANWFMSGIATEFANRGYEVNISHPTVGARQSAPEDSRPFQFIPLLSHVGTIEVYSSIAYRQPNEGGQRVWQGS